MMVFRQDRTPAAVQIALRTRKEASAILEAMERDRPARLAAIEITDPDDPRLDDYRDIRERDARSLRPPGGAERLDQSAARRGIFIGEQFLVIEKMLARPGVTKSILIERGHLRRFADRHQIVQPDDSTAIPLFVAAHELMARVAGFQVHRGALAIGRRPDPSALTLDHALRHIGRSGPATILLCEEIRNIDNIGMLFRSAAAFGADAVVLSPRCHDPFYRKALRVSIGHALSLPWARSTAWLDDLNRLKHDWDLTLVAASTSRGATPLEAIDQPERVGIVVGSEFDGIAAESMSRCHCLARIPMAEGVDSLNIATAAAIFLHRFSRGRRV
jgi:tRNA G18 (ribose-2'-O)-methylase SpoU